MNKSKLILPFLLLALAIIPVGAQTMMSDQQVLEYVQQSLSEEKNQQVIFTELARKGVSREQMQRVKQLYEQKRTQRMTDKASKNEKSRLRKPLDNENKKDFDKLNKWNDDNDQLFHDKKKKRQNQEYDLFDESLFEDDEQLDLKELEEMSPERKEWLLHQEKKRKQKQENEVFGRKIFNTRNLSFEPSINLATPPNYRLGPGDEVIIDVWGTSQHTIREEISPDGSINIDKIGPVNLNGMTVSMANEHIKKVLSRIYSGLDTNDGKLQVELTLGNTRTIQINVMGEVHNPGTYALSNFSTVFHALYRAGGVSEIGSLRCVKLVRGGRIVSTIDIYDFIMKGNMQHDIHLEEGDVIIVPTYDVMVKVKGKVKRPMRFEMKKDESIAALISYFGGFTSDAYTRSLRVVSQNGEEYEVNTVKAIDFSKYKMRNGDVVTVDAILNRFTNKLEVRGAVYRPGIYQLNGEVNTVRSLIAEAQGLMGDAFTNRAVLQRERENFTTKIISVDVKGIVDGTSPDIALKKNDVLYIPSIHDLEDRGEISVDGEISNPGNYTFSDNMTLEDLIIRAGGLKEAASLVRVDVSRRIKDPKSTVYSDSIGQFFSFSLKDGFVIEGEQGFILRPYDQVYVRRSPGYQIQQNIFIEGEALFPGKYALTQREERLSDVVKKAGGVTPKAYLRGAKLTRRANPSEMKRMEDVMKLMEKQFGQAMTDSLRIEVDSTYTVGIDLEKAIAEPQSTYDLVLREGDVLDIPVLNNTVKINGAVMMPNTVTYQKGKSVSYYLDQAGGYGLNAKKSKKFIIYMNGQVSRVGSSDKDEVQPGCEIFVPSKKNKRTNFSEILSYATSFGSLATMLATIANLVK